MTIPGAVVIKIVFQGDVGQVFIGGHQGETPMPMQLLALVLCLPLLLLIPLVSRAPAPSKPPPALAEVSRELEQLLEDFQ